MPRVHPFLLRSADANAARLPRLCSQAGVRCMRSFHNTIYMSSRCVFFLRAASAAMPRVHPFLLRSADLRLFLACRKRGDAAGTPFFASLGGCKCYALAPPLLASGCALHEVISQHKMHEFPLRFFLRAASAAVPRVHPFLLRSADANVPQARRCRGYTLFCFARRMQMLRACPASARKRVCVA